MTTMTKHSPAPFHSGDHGGGADIRDANDRRIASLSWGQRSVSMKVPFEEGMANQRLFLAAPALYAALDDLVGPGAIHELTCDQAEHDDDSECVYCCARAALAAARER